MAIKYFRVGSSANAVGYDNAAYDSAIETDEPIKAGPPIDSNDVVRLSDLLGAILFPVSVVNIDNPTELNAKAGTAGAIVIAFQTAGGGVVDQYSIYAYDMSGPAVDSPYVVDALGAGSERWIAVGGKYIAGSLSIRLGLIVDTNVLVVNSTSHNVGVGVSVPVTKLDIAGSARVTASTIPTSGAGLEVNYGLVGNTGLLISYDRDVNAYRALFLRGSVVVIDQSGLHVGGTSDPGNDNALIDGTLEVIGLTKTTGGVHVGGASDPGADNLEVDNNIGIGTETFPASMTQGIAVINGTAPTADVVDQFSMYSADVAGIGATPHFRNESGEIIKLYRQPHIEDADLTDVDVKLNTLLSYLENLNLLATV
jgi:hypothetical protein